MKHNIWLCSYSTLPTIPSVVVGIFWQSGETEVNRRHKKTGYVSKYWIYANAALVVQFKKIRNI